MVKKKTCFVIAPIGDPGSEIRRWSDTSLNYIIAPAVECCGYEKPIRADQIPGSGLISIQVIERLIKEDLVIADLTGHNPNVFYELAVRHAARKPFIQLIKKDERIPFDLRDLRTIEIDTEIAAASKAIEQLKRYIPEVEKEGPKIKNPISVAVAFEMMRESGDEQQKTLGNVLAKLEEMDSVSKLPFEEVYKAALRTNIFMEQLLPSIIEGLVEKGFVSSDMLAKMIHSLYPQRFTSIK